MLYDVHLSVWLWSKQNLKNHSLVVLRNMFSFSLHNCLKELSFLHISTFSLHYMIFLVCPCSPQTLSPFFALTSSSLPSLTLLPFLSQWWLSSQSLGRKKQCPDLLCVVWLVIFISSHFLGPNSSISISFLFFSFSLSPYFFSPHLDFLSCFWQPSWVTHYTVFLFTR